MKRRDFFVKGAFGVVATGLLPVIGNAAPAIIDNATNDRLKDKWLQVATGKKGIPSRKQMLTFL
jgi:ABC-type enterochelin transport system permease subunit